MFRYFEAARVGSWLGWIFNFGFGSVLFGVLPFERTVMVFFAFSLATASVFVLNQYFDREADRENEVKSNLPVASGRITPRRTLIFSFLLVISCLILVFMANVHVLPLFIVYLGLWTAYSTPPFRLKSVPVADLLISGIGAGFLPFLMGGGLTDKLISNIPSIMLGAMPLMLIHCGGHIIQAVGDCEADRETGVHTFVVRYGRKKGVIVAGFMFLMASFSPFVYSAFGLLPYRHLFLFFIIFPLSMPIIMRYADVLKNPSTKNVIHIQKRGPKTQKPKEYILSFSDIESVSGAARLIGRKVAWPVGKHEVRGKIVALHGKNGLVRARFKKGVPGQQLGSLVEIIG